MIRRRDSAKCAIAIPRIRRRDETVPPFFANPQRDTAIPRLRFRNCVSIPAIPPVRLSDGRFRGPHRSAPNRFLKRNRGQARRSTRRSRGSLVVRTIVRNVVVSVRDWIVVRPHHRDCRLASQVTRTVVEGKSGAGKSSRIRTLQLQITPVCLSVGRSVWVSTREFRSVRYHYRQPSRS